MENGKTVMSIADPSPVPELAVSTWLNTPEPLTLAGLRGRVVLLHAFQLLCPGCVAQSIPQVQRIVSPVGVDMADEQSPIPVTMRRYGFRGTPSSVLIGRDGTILHQTFGVEEDLVVGAWIAMALASAGTSQ